VADHHALWHHLAVEPGGDRSPPGAELQAPPPGGHPQCLEAAHAGRVDMRLEEGQARLLVAPVGVDLEPGWSPAGVAELTNPDSRAHPRAVHVPISQRGAALRLAVKSEAGRTATADALVLVPLEERRRGALETCRGTAPRGR
jgi:hypothetical protein